MKKNLWNPLLAPYIKKGYPQMILANRFDYTLSNIKYLLPQGLSDLKVLCICTAAYGQGEWNYDWMYDQDLNPLKSLWLQIEEYDIADKTEEEVRRASEDVDLIVVTGWDVYYLLKHMRVCNFGSLIKEKIEQWVMYLWTSAWAIVCCPDVDYIAPMDNPHKSWLITFEWMNLVPFKIVPHLNHPHLAGAAHTILSTWVEKKEYMLWLLDEQFIHYTSWVFRVL
jgi:dipeptidase E